MPGGFHPFHAGHLALYQSAQRAFPDAEVFVAATNDTSARPFPFALKEKLAQLAGVEPGHFVQVKSPFRTEEITSQFNPESDVLIFVRSEKDSTKPPQAGGVKKDGSLAYLQPLMGAKRLEPFARHAYMAYLPTVEFGPGMTSATEIRTAWPDLNEKRKTALVMSLYPATQKNPALAATVVKMLDTAMVAESINPMTANTSGAGAGMTATWQDRYNQPAMENQGWAATYEEENPDYIEEKWSAKYKQSINCASPKGFSQRAHCAGRQKNEDVAEGSTDTIYPNATVIKSKNGRPVGEIYQDGNSWGAFHYRADRGYDFIDSREEAIEALKDLHQETGRSGPDYTIKGVAEGIEDNYNKNDAGIKATLQAGVKLIPIQPNNDATGKPIYIHDNSGRYTVAVDMGGISVPFYNSTGLGGKAGVAVDKWYPFFGIGPDGWINKGSEEIINDFYGSNKLKRVAQVLNNTLGLPSRAKNVSGWSVNKGDENYFISAVNRGLDPAARSDRSTKLRDNMLSVLRGLGEPNKYVEKHTSRPKAYAFDKNNPEHVAAFDATSQSEREIAMALAKDPKSQGVAEAQLDEKCWDTHRQVGMKKKGNRMVPNCVPKESK